jgi:hypothetical protein
MDLWDVSRLMVRRWPVSVPLLLLAVVATVLTASNVRPDYVGTTYVSLLPPTAQRRAVEGQTLRLNPWDTERLTNAVIVRLNTKSVADQVEAEGFTGTWEAGLHETYDSVVRIEVRSHTPAQARSTIARLLTELDEEVVRQQAKYPNLGPDDKITTARLDSGDDVEISTGKIKRATVVMAVIGLLLTAAVSVAVDALLARRMRRRQARGRIIPHEPPTVERRPLGQVPGATSAPLSASPSAPTSPPVPTSLISTSVGADETQPVVRITNVPPRVPTSPAAPRADSGPAPDDSTIVLPLSNAPWADRSRGAAKGDGEAGKNDKTADVAPR